MYKLSLEREFTAVVAICVFNYMVERLKQYNKELESVDVPEFVRLSEDKIITKADAYVTKLIKEGKLYQVYSKLFV